MDWLSGEQQNTVFHSIGWLQSNNVAKDDLDGLILLFPPPETPPFLIYAVLGIESRASWMLGKRFNN